MASFAPRREMDAMWSGRPSRRSMLPIRPGSRRPAPASGAASGCNAVNKEVGEVKWWCAQSDTNRSPPCNSLLTGKINREFLRILGFWKRFFEMKSRCAAGVSTQIPCKKLTGKLFFDNRKISDPNRENLHRLKRCFTPCVYRESKSETY